MKKKLKHLIYIFSGSLSLTRVRLEEENKLLITAAILSTMIPQSLSPLKKYEHNQRSESKEGIRL